MSHAGKTQIAFIFTASPDQVAEGDRLFTSHAAWMEKTHHQDGARALLAYNVAKGPELSQPLDPSSKPTGNICFTLTEVYESPEGIADHWQQAPTWPEFSDFVAWAGSVEFKVMHGAPIVHSLW